MRTPDDRDVVSSADTHAREVEEPLTALPSDANQALRCAAKQLATAS